MHNILPLQWYWTTADHKYNFMFCEVHLSVLMNSIALMRCVLIGQNASAAYIYPSVNLSIHQTIIATKITHFNNKTITKFVYTSLLCSMFFWSKLRLTINKTTEIFFVTINLLKNWFLFLIFMKRKQKHKSEIAGNLLEIKLQLFSYKNVSQIVNKICFLTMCVLTHYLKHRNVNHTTSRIP